MSSESLAAPPKEEGVFKRLWTGSVSFPVTFWLLGVLATPFVWWGAKFCGRLAGGTEGLLFGLLLVAAYGVFVSVAVWRSSRRSAASKVWVFGALAAISVTWLAFVGFVAFGVFVVGLDLSTTSYTIRAELKPDPALPFVGFWKTDCAENFGLAIQKAGPDDYFARFCGPGGCMGKTRFMRTKLVGDPRYKILDHDTIGVSAPPRYLARAGSLNAEDREKLQERLRDGLLIFKRCD